MWTILSFLAGIFVKHLRKHDKTIIKKGFFFFSIVILFRYSSLHVNFPVMPVAPVTLELTAVSTPLFYQITITINQSISHRAGRHQVIIMSNQEADSLCINVDSSLCFNGTMPSPCAYCSSYKAKNSRHKTT